MKHIIIALLLVCGIFSSCRKFLSPDPVSSFSQDYAFDNVLNARSALLGAYHPLSGDYGYGIRISGYFPYDTDETMKGTGANTSDEGQLLAHYRGIPSNLQITNPFNQLYQGVERANLCIYNIPRMRQYNGGTAMEQAQLRRMHGEALVLRAQYLYELCRNWGDVPVQWEPSQYETELFKPRTSRDTIYSRLVDDLALAQTLMPWRKEVTTIGDAEDQRFTKGTAKALRAKIALTRGGYALPVTGGTPVRAADYLDYYEIARDECAEIMARRDQHTLHPSYTGLFRDYLLAHNMKDPGGEFMMVASMGVGGDSKLGIQTGTRMNGTGGGALSMLPTYFYMFDSTDERRDMTCVPYDIVFDTIKVGRAANSISDGKFRRQWVTNPSFIFSNGNASVSFRPVSNNSLQNMQLSWPLIRYADVLLWFAEADNELSGAPSPAAIAAVSEVSLRGHGGTYQETPPVIPTDKAGFFRFIVKERLLEFGGEGIRKYDLLRWGLLATCINETRARLEAWGRASAGAHPPFEPWSFMEQGPVYARDPAQLPSYLYFERTPARSDIYGFNPFLNSFYQPGPTISAPAGQGRVNWWIGGTSTLSIAGVFAGGFEAGKSELMPLPQTARDANPNLAPQNFGY